MPFKIETALEYSADWIASNIGEEFAAENPLFWIEFAKSVVAEGNEQSRHDDSLAIGRAIVSCQGS